MEVSLSPSEKSMKHRTMSCQTCATNQTSSTTLRSPDWISISSSFHLRNMCFRRVKILWGTYLGSIEADRGYWSPTGSNLELLLARPGYIQYRLGKGWWLCQCHRIRIIAIQTPNNHHPRVWSNLEFSLREPWRIGWSPDRRRMGKIFSTWSCIHDAPRIHLAEFWQRSCQRALCVPIPYSEFWQSPRKQFSWRIANQGQATAIWPYLCWTCLKWVAYLPLYMKQICRL